ncbi:MAG: hypothetical protein ABIU77_27155 [Ferruginibacter sp.]
MKKYFLPIIFLLFFSDVFGLADSVVVPIQRQRNHERIKDEQVKCDKADGKLDGMIKVSSNEEINLQVTDAIFRKIKDLQDFIETTSKVATNNEKIRQLNYVQEVVLNFRTEWKSHKLNPVLAPLLINNFEKILKANIDSQSMAPSIEEVPYEIGKINVEIFKANKGYNESKKIIYLKFCTLNPDKILSSIRSFVNEPFADSMVVQASLNNPKQLYDYASSGNSPEAKLIHKNTNPLVMAIVKISHTPNALFYFPFLDDIINGKQSIDSIKKLIGDGEERMDNIGYFKLLVKTEINYQQRLIARDTPVAMFGINGLREMLQTKAVQYFITPINELHEQNNLSIRMKAIEPLSAQDLYYVIVMGENDIYTSSYKHSFARLLQKMGAAPRGDELMLSVNMDFFRKFIKMAANFNQLDVFLKTMPQDKATVLMKAFVANLDKSSNLEDAVDVADSYSSIRDTALLETILKNVSNNEQRSMNDNNGRGKIIYSLLKTIFLSADSSNVDLTSEIGIPSIYSVENKYLADDSGRIVQQVFFYGDDDGKTNFSGFMNSFNTKEWKISQQREWVEIKSLKGRKKVWIYANLPLDSDKNLDDTAQAHLTRYLEKKDIVPSIVIHRGHSYWLPGTINRMAGSAKIIVLGSCGGYKNLSKILTICPEAHIISTKEIGKGDINRPIINYLNQALVSGNTIVWKDMWAALNKVFYADPNKEVRESWDDYVPPYRNLGAIFIKAYNKKTELQ